MGIFQPAMLVHQRVDGFLQCASIYIIHWVHRVAPLLVERHGTVSWLLAYRGLCVLRFCGRRWALKMGQMHVKQLVLESPICWPMPSLSWKQTVCKAKKKLGKCIVRTKPSWIVLPVPVLVLWYLVKLSSSQTRMSWVVYVEAVLT